MGTNIFIAHNISTDSTSLLIAIGALTAGVDITNVDWEDPDDSPDSSTFASVLWCAATTCDNSFLLDFTDVDRHHSLFDKFFMFF
jgi:hypothetical protein